MWGPGAGAAADRGRRGRTGRKGKLQENMGKKMENLVKKDVAILLLRVILALNWE
jgi:hypothetical protein